VGYINFAIFCRIGRVSAASGRNKRCHKCFFSCKTIPPWKTILPWILCWRRQPLPCSGHVWRVTATAGRRNQGYRFPVKKNMPLVKKIPPPEMCAFGGRKTQGCHECLLPVKNYPMLKSMLPAAATTTGSASIYGGTLSGKSLNWVVGSGFFLIISFNVPRLNWSVTKYTAPKLLQRGPK